MKNDLFNDRISRFSIRKLHVGVCSVLLGTLVMLGTATGVGADEVTQEKQVDGVATTTEADKTEAPVTTEAAEAAPAKEVTYQAEAAPAVSTEVKPELNSDKLATYVAEIEANLANGKYSSKTDESVEILKVALANAKNALTSATSQAELDAAYQSLVTTVNAKLKNKEKVVAEEKVATADKTEATTGKPAENTKPAEGTNSIANTGGNDPRNGKEIDKNTAFRADTATATGIGADVEDATSTPKVEKPGFTTDIKAADLASQISWLDFGDKTNWTGTTTTSDGKLALQVGATYTKEIMPGYVVTIKVKSLKPFQATELYKKRLEERGATEAEKATYDPNAKNGYINSIIDATTRAAFNNKEEAKVIADPQNRWTEIRKEGIDTGNKQTTISSEFNGGNIGVQFEISATFRGKVVKPAIVMADGESANPGELVLFTTNGSGWQHIGEWFKNNNKNTKNYVPQDTNNLFDPTKPNNVVNIDGVNITGLNLNLLRRATGVGEEGKTVAWKYYGSADLKTGGLGTGVFGPNISAANVSVPLVMTRGASEIGLYIASSGKQSAMLGFFPLDEGDAPESYGKAIHSIATVDGLTGKKVNQPYLGHLSPDMDENNTLDWTGDDKATTADEGIDQLLPNDLKGKTNELIKMDRTKPGNYTITVEAHTDGAPQANIYGWVDFNQNGTFDEDERSDLATITKDGAVTLRFTKSKTYIDPSVNELGVRLRIAKDAAQIESPTGMAFSGEVEDFKTQITHPPKGEVKETTGPQGAKQTATVAFTARGLQGYSLTESAKIDETVAPYIVDANGNKATLDAEGYYVVPGQGKYKITANGKDVDVEFIPEDHFLGTADGISIRRTDSNGYDTGWSTKFPADEANVDTVLNTMDGLYIPTVTPTEIEGVDKTSTDVQGATQIGTPTFNTTTTNANGDKISVTPSLEYPAKLVDPATGQVTNATSVTVAGEGTYSINDATGEVTFVPEPGFTGTAKGITVSLTAPVGRDKDGTVRDEYLKTATAKYTPTVTPITITPTDKVSENIQNVPQTQTPTFELSNDKTAKITSKKLVDPATGQPTDETTVTVAGEGSYTIDPTTGAVTFTPEKDFVGTAKGVTVQATATITNANGKTATITSDATYTPTVVPAVPTANPATSKDIQGATQTGTPTFAGTTVQVNGEDKAITIKDNSYTLLDKDGNEVSTTPAYAEDGTTPIGTFAINPATGTVTFTPTDKSYTGKVTPVKVQAESSNGIKVDTTYTPEIVPVTPTATPAETTDIQGATQKGKPEFKGGTVTVDGVEKTVPINEAVPATFDDGTTTKTVEGVGTYTVAADGTVTFVPEKSFVGTAPAVTVVREDKNGTKASATYTPTVTPVTPTATPVETTDIQGATQTGKPVFTEGDSRVPMDDDTPATFEDGSTTKTIPGEGTYTVAPDGTVTFVPEKSFTGTGTGVTVKRVDKNGTPVTAKYTPTVTPVTPTAEDVTSTDKQGQTQTGKPKFTEGDPVVPMDDDTPATFEDGSTTKTIQGEGTYTVAPDGTVTFVPEKSFTGTGTGVTVKRVDKNGTPVTAKYTPTVTPVTPTATPAESVAPQGVVQTGTVTFTEGDPVAPIDKDTITLLDENGQSATSVVAKSPEGKEIGTFTVDKATGVVTFTPTDKSYSGDVVAVKVQAKDANGTAVETTYTPKITPVVPTAEDATSTDKQGQEQTGKPNFTEGNPSVPMDDDVPATFDDGSTTKTIPGEGTYTVAPDGTVTFVPEKSFTGKGTGVTVKRVDKNGTPVTATYTPTVTPVVPTADPTTSTDIQGKTQTGKPTFTPGNPDVPMDDDTPATFEDGSTTKVIPGEGTYTVAPDGTVTFVPEKSFTGTGTGVTVKRVDKNGTPVTAKYTPTVTPVTPTADPTTSTDIQGKTQTGKPTFTPGNPDVPMDDDTPATFEDGSTTKVIPGEGTYTVAPDGTVTFVPEKSFTGTGTGVTVKRVDKNGTPVTAKYTPTVTPVTPTAEPVTSTDIQGQTQTGKPNFTEGNPSVPMDDDTPATFEDGSTTKVIPGEGTYTVAPDGTVTFVPEKSFTGTGTGVTVKRVDKNGTPVTAKYTPTVTPVTPTAEPATTIGPKGKEQSGKPTFKEGDSRVPMNDDVPATFDDGSTTKTIPGVGTYTVAPDGTVTFKPEPEFTGTAPSVTVVREDMNGTKASATYTPTVTPVTTFVDKEGKAIPGYPTEDGENPKKDIPGYRFVETKKLPNGDTEHVYEKVKTSHKDKDGNEIPGYPTEDGENPKKDIPGYRFVETKKLPNGDTEHVYEKVKTSHKDKDGNEIPGYPTEDGENPKKDIPGYRFVETKKLPNGDTEHVYEKVPTPDPVPTPAPTPDPVPTPVPAPKPASVPVKPTTPAPVAHTVETKEDAPQLPNTGTKDNASLAALGLVGVLSGFGLIARKKKED